MKFGENNMEYLTPELERDLVEIMSLGEMTGFQPGATVGPAARFPGEDKVGILLKKAREIANKHHPQSFSVTAGIPFGAQVSFTWNLPAYKQT